MSGSFVHLKDVGVDSPDDTVSSPLTGNSVRLPHFHLKNLVAEHKLDIYFHNYYFKSMQCSKLSFGESGWHSSHPSQL